MLVASEGCENVQTLAALGFGDRCLPILPPYCMIVHGGFESKNSEAGQGRGARGGVKAYKETRSTYSYDNDQAWWYRSDSKRLLPEVSGEGCLSDVEHDEESTRIDMHAKANVRIEQLGRFSLGVLVASAAWTAVYNSGENVQITFTKRIP